MRPTIGLLLASAGFAFLVAGCANQGGGAGASAGAGASSGGGATAASAAGGDTSNLRDFNLRVKCPGVHELKVHGWSDQQIMQQLSVEQNDIPACEQWVQSQPKGYVPPTPGGGTGAAPKAAAS